MHPHRRRKKRPSYGARTVDVSRGENGFGFTISGQRPCILSCVVAESPADAAGLRPGGFLVSVDGRDVSRLPHDAVVGLIGGSGSATIKMAIAENYFADSSDEEAYGDRPRYPSRPSRARKSHSHSQSQSHRPKARQERRTKPTNRSVDVDPRVEQARAINVVRDLKTGAMFEEAHADVDKNVKNTLVPQNEPILQQKESDSSVDTIENKTETFSKIIDKPTLECRAIVGYLGTIEMPKQIATSSKLQTVRSCIRKMRQEKRTPTTVLMTVSPCSMTLKNSSGELLAEYPAKRINYVSCSSENDYRFFGLVTSASYPIEINDYDSLQKGGVAYDVAISNSCHVFVIDSQSIDHQSHAKKADAFKIKCTVDPITGMCLEFPNSSEYVVNFIRIIYSLKLPNGFSGNISRLSNNIRSPRSSNFVRKINRPKLMNRSNMNQINNPVVKESDVVQQANSPQPSNHSEITTTSSNSDSGIGFHNDCQNISDRILVVDFPNPYMFNPREGKILPLKESNRPAGVVGLDADVDRQFLSNATPVVEGFGGQGRPLNHMEPIMLENISNQMSSQSIYLANSINEDQKIKSKLTVRAMPETKNCIPVEEASHYDPVYSDSLSCHEEHHYEIIYPDENNMRNENISNSYKKICNFSEMGVVQNVYYSERAVDVPATAKIEYFKNGNYSCDSMSVISSKSHDLNDKKSRNISIDDLSLYSSKSHDEIVTNSSKLRSKVRKIQTSVDDMLIFGLKKTKGKEKVHESSKDKENHVFLHPANVKLKTKKGKKGSIFKNKSEEAKRNCVRDKKNSETKFSVTVLDSSRPSVSVEDVHESSATFGVMRNNWCHLEGTASEPDLREYQGQLLSESSSPFSRWSGNSSGRLLTHRSYRRPGSLVTSEHDMYNKCETDEKTTNGEKQQQQTSNGGVASWAISLERLLSEPAGIHALAAFLEREFSAENIRFWTACERWTHTSPSARPALAITLHSKHLADGASDPVNVDASARHLVAERLALAPSDLFLQAQKQIFNLMKFDSYPRFIKSDIYKECLMAELQGRPSPYPGDPNLAIDPSDLSPASSPNKLKKSLSNAEDKRRKSLLPWHRRLRSKSRDRCFDDDDDNNDEIKSEHPTTEDHDPKGSNSSLLTGWDVTKGFNHKQCNSSNNCNGSSCGCGSTTGLCRVAVPGLSATSVVVAAGGDETVRQLLTRLLEKRALRFPFYEVYIPDSNKPIDIDQSSSILAGKEVTVEQRVIFRLDLPNRKMISIKSKPNKTLGDVLKPVLHKYGVGSSNGLCVTLENKIVELSQPVQGVDGHRLQVLLHTPPTQQNDSKNANVNSAVPSLDEITNRVFEELLQGKSEKISGNLEEESIKSDNYSSEHSSGIFGRFMRRDEHRSKGVKIKKHVPNSLTNQAVVRSIPQSASSEGGSSCIDDPNYNQKPLIAKLRAGVKIQNAVGVPGSMENTEFLENLKQIQRARLKNSALNGNHDIQKGKENNNVYHDEKQTSYNANLLPVAAVRAIPSAPNNVPCPAPRSLLGHANCSPRKSADLTDITNNKKFSNMEYSPQKSAFNSLENSMIEATRKTTERHSNPETQSKMVDNLNSSFHSSSSSCENENQRRISDPPPLPPKPKVLPIKPSNWGHVVLPDNDNLNNLHIKDLKTDRNKNSAYLDQPSSSFV